MRDMVARLAGWLLRRVTRPGEVVSVTVDRGGPYLDIPYCVVCDKPEHTCRRAKPHDGPVVRGLPDIIDHNWQWRDGAWSRKVK